MPMQFTSFDEAQTWYELREKIKALLLEKTKNSRFEHNHSEAIYVNDAATILTTYLYGPTQK
jgi:hypothetical protein